MRCAPDGLGPPRKRLPLVRKKARFTHDMTFFGRDVRRKRFKRYRRYLQKPFVPRKRFRWYRILVSHHGLGLPPLPPNPQQACHGISIRRSLGDKGFPTPDPNFGKAVLKVKHSFARVQNSRVRRTLGACSCRAKMKKAPRKFRSAVLGVGAEGVEPPTLCL